MTTESGRTFIDWDHEVTVVDMEDGTPYVASMGLPTSGYIPYTAQDRDIDQYRGILMPFEQLARSLRP